MITDKSRYGHDAVLDLNCGDSVQVLRTEPMTLTEQEQKIVQKYLGIALLERSYIDANGHLMVVLSDGRTLDVGSARGLSGATPYLGENGNWFVEGVDTLQSARGLPGFTPYIGENEHWWIDGTDTGIPARGIPLTEKADNTRFLRNDGTWQKVTPENIGAAKQSDFAAQKSIVTDHTNRIEALEQRTVTAPYYTDDSVAYVKDVPENALPFASVDMVGGITRKCTNLLPLNDMETTILGCAVRVSNGVITINGTATGSGGRNVAISTVTLPAGTYKFSANDGDLLLSRTDGDLGIVGTIANVFELTKETTLKLGFNYVSGRTYSLSTTAHINSGTTALPYEPYFDGLRSAPVTEVESVGVNLQSPFTVGFDVNDSSGEPRPNSKSAVTDLIKIDGDKTYLWSGIDSSTKTDVYCYNENKVYMGRAGTGFFESRPVNISCIVANKNIVGKLTYVRLMYFNSDNIKEAIASPTMLNEGIEPLPYTPYVRNTLPIPEAVQNIDGYGWGVNDEVYNYVDWEKKQFVKRVVRVDMGTLNWAYNDLGFMSTPIGGVDEILTSCNYSYSYYVNGVLRLFGTGYTDAATFKAAVQGVMLYYELAEPVITDISDLLPDDNLIRVEGGCTVTMVNEYRYDVPSEITYARLTWQ